MKTIIVGTDFTQSSNNACRYAAALADKLSCKLTVFNLFQAPVLHSNSGLYGISYAAQRKTSENNIQEVILEIKNLYPRLKINSLSTSGAFVEELEVFTKRHHVVSVVMGLEAKTKISKFIYGSRGVKIVGKIDTPVIIVPEKYRIHKLSKILLAVDNKDKLKQISLNKFENIAGQIKAKVELLHVKTPGEIFTAKAVTLKINGSKRIINMIEAENTEAGIKKYCKEYFPDLIAIISKKHSPLYNFFVERNTKKIAFASKVPVMSIHE